jgi:hypothetical protein
MEARGTDSFDSGPSELVGRGQNRDHIDYWYTSKISLSSPCTESDGCFQL